MTAPLFASPNDCMEFERRITTRAIGKHIHFFEQTQSTNDLALDAARNGGPHGTVFAADAQDAGRGRRGRQWDCPPGMGLLFSVLLRPAAIPLEAGGWIPLVAGLSCAEALASLFEKLRSLALKWPNDIVLPTDAAPGWKKLGGILCESALPALSSATLLSDADCGYAVIGIGLNLNQTRDMLPVTEKAPASSVRLETDGIVDRQRVLKAVLERLEINLDKLSGETQRAAIRATLEEKMRAWLPPWKTLLFRSPPADSASLRRGTFSGLDEYGRIRILDSAGETAYADAEIVGVE